ncbi:MAG TPA: hypothetical protein VGQ55_13255 [Pyrinomonadaceae bacterium]|nr:hypothetical protein [Pyrinomonadaceae bacterium]
METAEARIIEGADSRLSRYNWLLAENHRIARGNALYRNDRELLEAETMRRPVKISKAYRYFGLMLGAIPPAAIVIKIAATESVIRPGQIAFLLLIAFAGMVTGLVGYFSGKLTAKTVKRTEKFALPNRAALIAFIGMTWGIACGTAGGVFIFVIGAFPAAFIGAVAGFVTLPIFATLLNFARSGDRVALSRFLPISLGIVLSIAGFILGL